jgi:hypothetical protein
VLKAGTKMSDPSLARDPGRGGAPPRVGASTSERRRPGRLAGHHGAGPVPKRDQLPAAKLVARPFDEALPFEIALACEAGIKYRRPPNGFGSLKDEP